MLPFYPWEKPILSGRQSVDMIEIVGTLWVGCIVAGMAVKVKVKGLDHPGLRKQPLAMGTWNVTLLRGRSLRL